MHRCGDMIMMPPYKLRVDTGGTFTDCWGLSPEPGASPKLVKVLSSGRLRLAVEDWLSPRKLRIAIPPSWELSDSFFTGYKLGAGESDALVLSHQASDQILTLSRDVTSTESIDLFTREEAPVLGARILTGTRLDDVFPALDFRLATTRGTNALLERKGAPLAFFTTRGFADLLVIRDQRRPDLFALQHHRPAPLFSEVVEVGGRLAADGSVLEELVLDDAFDATVRAMLDRGIRVAAVALLHSYREPSHELILQRRLLDLGMDHVSVSSDLAPLIKLLPRAETAVINAYLQPIMAGFLGQIATSLGVGQDTDTSLMTMTSAGGLEPVSTYCPKDSLLSGPAGGVSGAASVAEELGFPRVLTFDMGGTSTDVARYDHGFQYRFSQVVGDATLLSPGLKIETVAAGGGSICRWEDGRLRVGPESAGADPGPACYGRGGPLTITDVNLLLGRIDPENFGIPLTPTTLAAAQSAALDLQRVSGHGESGTKPDPTFLSGLLELAVEQMADAIRTISIRDGADPAEYALLAFGGAGPLHACDIAERLGIHTILVPAEAGLLSAYGLDQAGLERFAERQVNAGLDDPSLPAIAEAITQEALEKLHHVGGAAGGITRRVAELRLAGQDSTLSLTFTELSQLGLLFAEAYTGTYGYAPPTDRSIEVVSLHMIAGTGRAAPRGADRTGYGVGPNPIQSVSGSGFLDRAVLSRDDQAQGPVVIQDRFSTFFLKADWSATVAGNGALVATRTAASDAARNSDRPLAITRELFRHRFDHLVTEMGTMLHRTAISTNVKERADYSCALLDGAGELISSAPHIPVHLGALGMCVRMVRERIEMRPGDAIVTNHPAVGGSHLPDVTVITPVFAPGESNPLAYLANRAHHAEIGGITPGSMPPAAQCLAEEGVVIAPRHLLRSGASCFDEVADLLQSGPYPTRRLADNLADLHAQLAANHRGQALLESLLNEVGADIVREQLRHLKEGSLTALSEHLATSDFAIGEAIETLDDSTEIQVRLENTNGRLRIDFTGTAAAHPGNLHATPAIVQSAILYVLRLWTQSPVPLNEGLLASVDIVLPECFLNPRFSEDPTRSPAVVGGNVETSQRLVDALLRALGVQACSQGTMNNFLFGDDSFGYYETICGGSGAGSGYHGSSGLHTHMTNTAITDPEILEQRYPIRLHRFSLRSGSGGAGRWRGGEGVIREVEFLQPLQVSLLTQHRVVAPYGMDGGGSADLGRQTLNGKTLPGIVAFAVAPGDRLVIETPGGGGFGT